MAKYNIWFNDVNRWTNSEGQDPLKPKQTTYIDAVQWAARMGLVTSRRYAQWNIRVICADGVTPGVIVNSEAEAIALDQTMDAVSDTNMVLNSTVPAVNDYVCKACHNDRCSRSERSCWKCGEPINAKHG